MGPPTQMWTMPAWPAGAPEPWPTTPGSALPPHTPATPIPPIKPPSSTGWVSPRDRRSPDHKKRKDKKKKEKEKDEKTEDSKMLDLDTR